MAKCKSCGLYSIKVRIINNHSNKLRIINNPSYRFEIYLREKEVSFLFIL